MIAPLDDDRPRDPIGEVREMLRMVLWELRQGAREADGGTASRGAESRTPR